MINASISKEQWVEMFKDIGFDEKTMHKWHQLFEQRHPQAHAFFLQWLGIPAEEIDQIRNSVEG